MLRATEWVLLAVLGPVALTWTTQPVAESVRPGGCGDRLCSPGAGENCATCPSDCACGANERCFLQRCEPRSRCGDGRCDVLEREDCASCPTDCRCSPGTDCVSGRCRQSCGDGHCEATQGETCASCRADCACAPTEDCRQGICTERVRCGDGVCDLIGEDCIHCPLDCGDCTNDTPQ